jgi:hypothetical protein
MSSEDPRQNNRRHSERRAKERRVIIHPFNSPEWIDEIKQSYLLWPKEDRRIKDRRTESRRSGHRRTGSIANTPIGSSKKTYDLLTNEEKKMLNELTQTDASD